MTGCEALKDRYERVRERVAAAARRSGRRASDVLLVAVTKAATPEQVRELVALGHRDLGENRVQHLDERVRTSTEALAAHGKIGGGDPGGSPDAVRWHMIGHLQRNKVKQVLPLVKLIHGVDSLRLAEEIEKQAAKADREADVLLQVNILGEKSKHGVAPAAAPHFVEQAQSMARLRLRGLMVMAPYADDPEASRPVFERAAELHRDILREGRCGRRFNLLSMGMSNDYEVAIECGANIVRVGTALFGEAE